MPRRLRKHTLTSEREGTQNPEGPQRKFKRRNICIIVKEIHAGRTGKKRERGGNG